MKKLLTKAAVFILLLQGAFSQAEQKKIYAIESCYNINQPDKKNILTWKINRTKTKDSFDEISSASKNHSTQALKEIYFDSVQKLKTGPKGYYELLLFSVSSQNIKENELFQVTQQGKEIKVFFTHRGTAYKIQTDSKGYLNFTDGFQTSEIFAVNHSGKFQIKSKYLKTSDTAFQNDKAKKEDQSSEKQDAEKTEEFNPELCSIDKLDIEKLEFITDKYDDSVKKYWNGKVKLTFDGTYLKTKGKITYQDIPEVKTEETEQTEPAAEETKVSETPVSSLDLEERTPLDQESASAK